MRLLDESKYYNTFLILVSLSLLLLFAAYVHIQRIEPFIALNGFSALDFANAILYPDHFLRDYPGGAVSIKNSILPWIYPHLMKAGFSFHVIYSIMVFCEITTLCIGSLILLRTINPLARPLDYLFLCSLLSLSWIRAGNLANFGNPFFHGQFYGFADGLSLMAIAFLLQKRMLLSFMLFIVSYLIHPLITAFAFAFTSIYQFIVIKTRKDYFTTILYMTLLGVFGAVWYMVLLHGAHEPMTTSEFFNYSYVFNFHWFPQDLKLFTLNNCRYANAFFGAFLFGVTIIARTDQLQINRAAFLFGLFGLLFISLAGCCFAYFEFFPTLVRACLQRASVLILTLITILVTNQSINDFYNHRYLFFFLSIFCMMEAFFNLNTWPNLAVIIYAVVFLSTQKRERKVFLNQITKISLLIYICYQIYLLYTHNSTFMDYYLQIKMISKWGLLFSLTVFFVAPSIAYVLQYIFTHSKFSNIEKCRVQTIMDGQPARFKIETYLLLIFLGLSIFFWVKTFLYNDSLHLKKNANYQKVQIWAEQHTEKTALFMIDPSYAYGWRDFSKRSSFGSPYEWLNTAWLYNGDSQLLHEGIQRTLMLTEDLNIIPSQHSTDKDLLMRTIVMHSLNNFYKRDGSIIGKIVRKYKIDYIVFDKLNAQKYGGIPKWKKIYENESYIVLSHKNR